MRTAIAHAKLYQSQAISATKSFCRIHEALASCQKALIQANGII